jgi:Mycobacterium membrane protein
MARTGTDIRNDHPVSVGAAEPVAAAEPKPRPRRRRGLRPGGIFKRLWLLVVVVLVVAIAGFVVFRLHGVFGKTETTRPGSGLANDTKPFNPKRVKYEIFGAPGTVATINYLDLNAQPQEVKDVALPWSILLTTTAPAASATIVAQGNSNSIGCRITVNDEVKDEKTSNEVNAQTFCLVKSA